MTRQEEKVERWNKEVPVGTEVIVEKDDGKVVVTKTRSAAWTLCGTAVVMVEGISGGYSLRRVKVIG